jgi:hypothetical protein
MSLHYRTKTILHGTYTGKKKREYSLIPHLIHTHHPKQVTDTDTLLLLLRPPPADPVQSIVSDLLMQMQQPSPTKRAKPKLVVAACV